MKKNLLLVDDDQSLCLVTQHQLEQAGFTVFTASDGVEALKIFKTHQIDLTITDIQMPHLDGMQLLSELKRLDPECVVIVITAYGSIQTAVAAMKAGAYDYITKPFEREDLHLTVKRALGFKALQNDNLRLRQELVDKYRFENIIGGSAPVQNLFNTIGRVSHTDSTVLIEGESGTGKELVARAIHYNSPRAAKNFVAVNCPGIPEHLLESELFGHVRGSFTGAVADKVGKFELADGGTIFLDEVGDMWPQLQAKLLRVLQEREIDKIGGQAPLKINVRVIAATNKNLKKAVEAGTFRADLYYRLSVVPIHLPPLRERKDDIPLLVGHFLQKYHASAGKVDRAVYQQLEKYNWPGNVRELENVIEQTLIMRQHQERISVDDLPEYIRLQLEPSFTTFKLPPQGLILDDLVKDLFKQALINAKGNQSQAARLLGLPRHVFLYKLAKVGLK